MYFKYDIFKRSLLLSVHFKRIHLIYYHEILFLVGHPSPTKFKRKNPPFTREKKSDRFLAVRNKVRSVITRYLINSAVTTYLTRCRGARMMCQKNIYLFFYCVNCATANNYTLFCLYFNNWNTNWNSDCAVEDEKPIQYI